MRVKYLTKEQKIGQFLTPQPIARMLARQLSQGGQNLLELGTGAGALIQAVKRTHGLLNILAVEADKRLAALARKAVPDASILVADALKSKILGQVKASAPFDYVVGNPPYALAAQDAKHVGILQRWCLHDPNRGLRMDALFLAHSLDVLRPGGSAAFVLPVSFFTDAPFRGFRAALMQRFASIKIIELPSTTFGGAEVNTVVCVLKGLRGARCVVELGTANAKGAILDKVCITESDASERMDYSYHKAIHQLWEEVGRGCTTLGQLQATVLRGSATSIDFFRAGVEHLHTTDLPVSGIGRFRYGNKIESPYNQIRTGDIAVPRVGTRCLLRQAVVVRGQAAYSESIYRVRVASEHRSQVLTAFAGPIGEEWRRLHARGSCAKHLTVADILSMPISN